MSQTTSSAMSEGPHLCLKNMLSKTEIVQFKALAANKLPIRRIFELTDGICCAVVQRNLQEQSVRIGSRQLQRFSEPWRLQYKAVKIHVFVAALVFSRRIFAKAYPAKNQTAWLDGIKSAFFSSRRVRERLSATTPDVWFAPTTAAAQPNGRKPIACASYHP